MPDDQQSATGTASLAEQLLELQAREKALQAALRQKNELLAAEAERSRLLSSKLLDMSSHLERCRVMLKESVETAENSSAANVKLSAQIVALRGDFDKLSEENKRLSDLVAMQEAELKSLREAALARNAADGGSRATQSAGATATGHSTQECSNPACAVKHLQLQNELQLVRSKADNWEANAKQWEADFLKKSDQMIEIIEQLDNAKVRAAEFEERAKDAEAKYLEEKRQRVALEQRLENLGLSGFAPRKSQISQARKYSVLRLTGEQRTAIDNANNMENMRNDERKAPEPLRTSPGAPKTGGQLRGGRRAVTVAPMETVHEALKLHAESHGQSPPETPSPMPASELSLKPSLVKANSLSSTAATSSAATAATPASSTQSSPSKASDQSNSSNSACFRVEDLKPKPLTMMTFAPPSPLLESSKSADGVDAGLDDSSAPPPPPPEEDEYAGTQVDESKLVARTKQVGFVADPIVTNYSPEVEPEFDFDTTPPPAPPAEDDEGQQSGAVNGASNATTTSVVPSQTQSSVSAPSTTSAVADYILDDDAEFQWDCDLPPKRAALIIEEAVNRLRRTFLLGKDAVEYLTGEIQEVAECVTSERELRAAIERIHREYLASPYNLLAKIGSGGFGAVHKGINSKTGELVAIKVVNLETEDDDDVDAINREIAALSQTGSCPQLIGYRGSEVRGARLWIIMEYVDGGSVLDVIKRRGALDEKYIAIIAREVLLGLSYLASQGKIHRDIKAANILLSRDGQVKLADFGASRTLHDTLAKCSTFVGSPYWMAPEVMLQSEYDSKADVWSLGITCLELAYGKPPHTHVNPLAALQLIIKSPPPQIEGPSWSKDFKDFVAQCLVKDPAQRASMNDLLKHRWIKNAKRVKVISELFKD